jgi:hypothetical protein
VTDLVERRDLDQADVFYFTQKINIAFEILKCEVERTEEHVINTLRWRGETRIKPRSSGGWEVIRVDESCNCRSRWTAIYAHSLRGDFFVCYVTSAQN